MESKSSYDSFNVMKRPFSVTFLGWLFIVVGLAGLSAITW